MPCLSNRGFYRGQNHQKCKQMINNRKLTLFQRAIYANSWLLSKVWYITHIYPLTQYYAKEINKVTFNYIWNGSYEPIRRSTVYRSRKEGGLGIINCLVKSQVILLNYFLQYCNDEDLINPLMLYYYYIRMGNIISMKFFQSIFADMECLFKKSLICVVIFAANQYSLKNIFKKLCPV